MRKYIVCIVLLVVAALLAVPAVFLTDCYSGDEGQTYVYIGQGDTPAAVKSRLSEAGVRATGFPLLSWVVGYRVRPGRYVVRHGDNILALFRRLRNGQQEPVNLTIPSVRTMDRLAVYLGERLMLDSLELRKAFSDPQFCEQYGYTVATLPALFIPNTYQLYWNVSVDDFMKRMLRENRAFWTEERSRKAQALRMSHEEVATLASIVDEETANNSEKPMVAGMYINRLRLYIPLQADPTVKFALGDFSLRRIWGRHLTVDSPYNTYTNIGLPPGPIRIASVVGIDAVLDYDPHNYLFMCAKEDFSGTHNFASTYNEHLRNARRYARALNERGIK